VIPLFLVNRHIRAISSFHESSVSASVWNALKGPNVAVRPAAGRDPPGLRFDVQQCTERFMEPAPAAGRSSVFLIRIIQIKSPGASRKSKPNHLPFQRFIKPSADCF
jgi:hypothetical protein